IAACSAAVPLLTTTACAAPVARASADSKSATVGPLVSQSDRSTRTTAATSSSSIVCRPYGSSSVRIGVPPCNASCATFRSSGTGLAYRGGGGGLNGIVYGREPIARAPRRASTRTRLPRARLLDLLRSQHPVARAAVQHEPVAAALRRAVRCRPVDGARAAA